jgi:hypothetical protein
LRPNIGRSQNADLGPEPAAHLSGSRLGANSRLWDTSSILNRCAERQDILQAEVQHLLDWLRTLATGPDCDWQVLSLIRSAFRRINFGQAFLIAGLWQLV